MTSKKKQIITKIPAAMSQNLNEELSRLKNYERLKMKCVLQSEDGGRTWFVARQFYVADASPSKVYIAEASHSEDIKDDTFVVVNLEGLVLVVE